jgi:glycosyltransferase involved in cell wall biosynthesis
MSALQQTVRDIEVIVVIDGPDQASITVLNGIRDVRLRLVPLGAKVGAAEARNIGIRHATGNFVALLDDDDEWLPRKLEKQIAVARQNPDERILIACWYLEKSSSGSRLEAIRSLDEGEEVSDYLFCDVPFFGLRRGFIQTSTWLAPRQLLSAEPFSKNLIKDQDSDWILRALSHGRGKILVVQEVLSVFHNEPAANRISRSTSWRASRDWALENRHLFTRKALSFFLISSCLPALIKQRAGFTNLLRLIHDCRHSGSITPKLAWLLIRNLTFFFLASHLFTPETQRRVRLAFSSLSR